MTLPAPVPDHFHGALAALAAAQGGDAAILAPGREPLRFAQLLERVVEIRAALNAMGIGRGDRVAAALPACAETAVCFVGVAACATYAPLNPDYTEDEFARYLDRLRPRAVIVPADAGAAVRSAARRLGIRIIDLVGSTSGAAGAFQLQCDAITDCAMPEWAAGEDLALILLTSGTTDRPKLVPMKHRHLTAHVRASWSHFALDRRDRFLHAVPMFHGHGLKSGIALPLLSGSGLICPPRFDVPSFFEAIATMGVTWYSAGYTLQQAIFDRVREYRRVAEQARLRFIVTSSGATHPKVIRGLEDAFGAPVLNRYSSSETCVISCEPLPPALRKPGTAGVPMLNEVRVVDGNGVPLGVGIDGEIVTRGPGVMDGYLDDPEANERAFVDGWFRTGDAGRLDADGYLTITGRIKELINRGGEKIAPTEVERVIGEHPAVARVCVFGVPHPTLGEDVAAAVVPVPGAAASERSIVEFAGARLAGFKVPRRVVLVADFPQVAAGKTDRRALARAYAAPGQTMLPEAPVSASPPTGIEGEVAALWRRILKLEHVERDRDFFLAGGDSLKIAELILAIQQRFGVCLGMRAVVDEGATAAALGRLIERSKREPGGSACLPEGVMPLKVDGPRTPLFAVPGNDGNSGAYLHFCRLLDARQPLYGLQSRGLDGAAPPLGRMEDIAADHVARMRALQPGGPYSLIGACFGGRVAYEMARQLEAAGERIALLVLLDPSPPFTDAHGQPRGETAQRTRSPRLPPLPRFILDRLRMYAREYAQLDPQGRRAYLWAKLGVVRGIVAHRDLFRGDPSELHARAVHEANRAAGRRYVPGNYTGPVIVALTEGRVDAGPRNYRLDWFDLLPQSGPPRYVPGRDTGDMLIPPNVYTLAQRVNAWLDDAQPRAAESPQTPPARDRARAEAAALPAAHAGERR